MLIKLKIFLRTFPLEGYLWISALLFISFISINTTHFTLCPFNNLGIEFCPGCGLGRSMNQFIMLDFAGSFNTHPFGCIALIIIIGRIFLLIKNNLHQIKINIPY